MEGDFSVQTFASYGEEQHPQNRFDPFDKIDEPHQSNSSTGKLFVGGIAWETSKESFASYFRKYGEVLDSIIMMDRISGKSRGFGFVTFADSSVADFVLDQEHFIDGRGVDVKRTVPREETLLKGVPKSKKIFVGGILPSLSEDEFKDYFSSYGVIVEQQIMFDHNTGRSRGFGFVTFENEEAVEKVLSGGKTHELGGKQVEIKRAIPKNDNGSDRQTHRGGGGYVSKSYNNSFNHGYDINVGNSGEMGSYENFWGGGYGGMTAGYYGGYGYGYGYGAPMYNAGGYFNPMSYIGTNVYGGGYGNGGGFGHAEAEARYHPYRR
ncbi:heterogeneous nuclear ribonucleoprotein 1 [Impatiens glandulifera]|uniref:heterogeneous nuclear ribonucleoprotein 1 n=1 Tax=Impatiens glandulifera TaxID=253017 RepID=UPI001FB0B6EE|nr:heterogeneous nuclear ribonucleoprotein 1 [Impatiens glandulifera]